MVNVNALREKARTLSRKSRFGKAALIFRQLSNAEPDNPRWPHKEGEAYHKAGKKDDAIVAFETAAGCYAAQGFLLKAIAVCKLILELDGSHEKTQEMLATLYSRRGDVDQVKLRTAALQAGGRLRVTAAHEPAEPPAQAVEIEAEPPAQAVEIEADPPEQAVEIEAEPPEKAVEIEAEPLFVSPVDMSAPTLQYSPPATDRSSSPSHAAPPLSAVSTASGEPLARGDSLDALELHSALPHVAINPVGSSFEIKLDGYDDTLEPGASNRDLDPVSRTLLEQLPPTPLFSALDRPALRLLIERVEVALTNDGEQIIAQGSSDDALYVLAEGEVIVSRDGRELNRLVEGAFFGEIALLTDLERSATVTTVGECTLLKIKRALVHELIEAHPEVLTVLLGFMRERLVDTLVETSKLFSSFAVDERASLARRFAFVETRPGCELLRAGDEVDGLYALLCGHAELFAPDAADGPPLALGVGDVFGAAALLSGDAATVSVRTRGKCWLLRLDRAAFRELIMTHPQMLEALAELAEPRKLGEPAERAAKPPIL